MTQIPYLPFAFPGLDSVHCAFTTRPPKDLAHDENGGNLSFGFGDRDDEVSMRRQGLMQELGFQSWVTVRQVHGTDMVFSPEEHHGEDRPQADAMATASAGEALAVSIADCQPVMLAHVSGRYVAGLHIGWRGNRAQAPSLWARAFCDHYGLRPSDILAVRGPSLSPACSEFVNFDSEWGPGFRDYLDRETMTVDLWRMTRDQLLEAGLKPKNIFSIDLCTFSLPRLFYSFRRNRSCGRQAALIWIRSPG
jgi:hypothetical protein